jgi:LPXTG-motif cell wall-anchored protein
VAALLTQAAAAQKTVIPTSTLLPKSGFADEVGAPSLLGLAVLLVVVIFLARRLRTAH